jgi:hypothetical protein
VHHAGIKQKDLAARRLQIAQICTACEIGDLLVRRARDQNADIDTASSGNAKRFTQAVSGQKIRGRDPNAGIGAVNGV